MHHSQQILIDSVDELRISLRLLITHDLKMEIRMYGNSVKVIQPEGKHSVNPVLFCEKNSPIFRESLKCS
jgi:hypothetical protein